MSDRRTEPHSTRPPEAREEAPLHASGQNTHQTVRTPSKIERREWRGSGVCGDSHTD